jgi:hypothetical protein
MTKLEQEERSKEQIKQKTPATGRGFVFITGSV